MDQFDSNEGIEGDDKSNKNLSAPNFAIENILDLIANELNVYTINNRDNRDSGNLNSMDKLRPDSIEEQNPQHSKAIEELIKKLAENPTTGVAYFSLFVCGAENNKKLLDVVSSIHGSLVDPAITKEFIKDPAQGLFLNSIVGTIALEHVVATKSVAAIRYVLEVSNRIGISISISELSVEKLLISFKDSNCNDIIHLLLRNQVVLVYQKSENEFKNLQNEAGNIMTVIEDHIETNKNKNKNLKLKPSK